MVSSVLGIGLDMMGASKACSIVRTGGPALMMVFMGLFVVSSTGASEDLQDSGPARNSSREGKFLSMFQVVKFPNDPCKVDTKRGTCYTAAECTDKGGTNTGSCASGYGVCCTFSLTCGGVSRENSTYFESTGSEVGACRIKICPCNDNICQLRLDFTNFVINGPNTLTTTTMKVMNGVVTSGAGKEATVASRCLVDSFTVTNPGGSSPPTICGTNTNEHMYVQSSKACNELVMNLGAGTTAASRAWSMRITQYACDYTNLAPVGCTQYFFGSSTGQVRSYNYNGGKGYNLADQDQSICVRREKGNCRICWATTEFTDFVISSKSAMVSGYVSTACCGYGADAMKTTGYDCVVIPSASKAADGSILKVKGFCGQGGLVSSKGPVAKIATICSKKTPFLIRFLSDSYEFAEEAKSANNKGFQLNYIQSCT